MRKAATLIVALGIAVTLGIGSKAEAGPIQLGFILDSSGSIGTTGWNTMRTGLANAILSEIPLGGLYEVSVVTFSAALGQTIGNVVVTDAASRTALANQVAALNYLGSTTNFAAAFGAMAGLLNPAGTSYVNFATDGQANVDTADTIPKLNLLKAAADNISVEGIGTGIDTGFLQGTVCYPGPCDLTSPYNFPAQGFYLGVADAQGYADAIGNKIQTVVTAPDPGSSLLLLGMGLVGLRAWRKRCQ